MPPPPALEPPAPDARRPATQRAEARAPSHPRALPLLGAAVIALATALAYAPALTGGFLWDDDAHVTRPELRSMPGLARIWFEIGATQQYYPLLHSAFWLEHRLWGDHPAGYHAVNIALHAVCAALVLAIVRRLLRQRGAPWADAAACLSAAVFALHPVHVESVAWITEQKNTLSGALYLGAMLSYLFFDRSRSPGSYAIAVGLFALSLLSKPVTVTLPAALLVVLWWLHGRLSWKRDVLPLAPWFAVAIESGLLTAWVEHDVIGAQGDQFAVSGAARLLLPGRVVLFYLSKLLWPGELIFVYPRWTIDPAVPWQWLFPAAALALLAAAALTTRRTRAPLAGLLFYCGSLFPVLGFFNVYLFQYTFVADHFQYLPSLGLIVLLCGAASAAAWKAPSRTAAIAILCAAPVALGVLTFRQCRVYADAVTLWEATLERNPDCWMAHNNLGIVLQEQHRAEEATLHYRAALAVRPGYPEAHNNLGTLLSELGRTPEAISEFREAIRHRPRYPNALANLAGALIDAGRPAEAIAPAEAAAGFDPRSPRSHVALGIALAMNGRHAGAAEHFETAARLAPEMPEAQWNLALSLRAMGRGPEATAAAQRARDLAQRSGRAEMVSAIETWLRGGGTGSTR